MSADHKATALYIVFVVIALGSIGYGLGRTYGGYTGCNADGTGRSWIWVGGFILATVAALMLLGEF